jgi:hypothetical protein
LQGGVVPSRQSVGPSSRLVAAGLSSCDTVLPATQADNRNAAKLKLSIVFTIAP